MKLQYKIISGLSPKKNLTQAIEKYFSGAKLQIFKAWQIESFKTGDSLMHFAVQENMYGLAEFLKKNQYPLNLKNTAGKTPLDIASEIETTSKKIVKLLQTPDR